MQFVVAALPTIRCGVGDVLAMILPADSVAFRRHQGDELGAAPRVAHALVYGIGQPQLPTLTLQRNVILRAIHAAGMVLLIRLEHRQPQLTAYLIVAAHQVLQLLLCHVEFLACLEVDGVDDAVGVDVVTVYMGADQHLATVEVFRQPTCGFVCLPWIDQFPSWEALHHVVEHHAAVFVVEKLRVEKIVVDTLHLTVDAADELLPLPHSFLLLHNVGHNAAHAAAGLRPLLVVHEMYDSDTDLTVLPPLTAMRH